MSHPYEDPDTARAFHAHDLEVENPSYFKRCVRCGETKETAALKRDRRQRDGYSSYCRACHCAATTAWQKANPERVKAGQTARRKRNRKKILAQQRARYTTERNRRYHLRYCYGLTHEAYNALAEAQGYACAICGTHASDLRQSLSVDHDHNCCPGKYTCGKCVRGLLCGPCNLSLHRAEDRDWIHKALSYLEKTK